MTFAGDRALRDEGRQVGRPVDDVDLLVVQLGGDGAHALAELADARALGVDAGLRRAHGDLGAVAGLARQRRDLDEPAGDLGHLEREQLAHETRDACGSP